MTDKIRGCLAGGAMGDALGYAIEFHKESLIFSNYGNNGITKYEIDSKTGKALISDDTQMTLFTATGILTGSCYVVLYDIEHSYFDWLITQHCSFDEAKEYKIHNSWLRNIPEIYSPRAPGYTCLSALKERSESSEKTESFIDSKINGSKGCGGVMRVAPIGFIRGKSIEEVALLAAQAAAITHSHSLGYMPAAVLAQIINRILYNQEMSLAEIITEARDTAKKLFAHDPYIQELSDIIDLAVSLADNKDTDLDNIHRLGEGWVAEEALAIAIYSSLRYQNDFSGGIIASVNHNGDSDSTGAITGNIIGSICGYDAIDDKWKKDLEMIDVIIKVADDFK